MSQLFSSPSKQAQSAASAAQGISQQSIQQAEQYVSGQEDKLRGALQGLGPNPFFSAGADVSPTPVDAGKTQSFSAPPPPPQGAPGGFAASGGVTAPMYQGATGPLAQPNPFAQRPPQPVMRNPGAP